jgi:VanZ family protein
MSESASLLLTAAPPRNQASALARIALLFYGLLIVYASLYPLSGWRDNGLAPWSYLFEHMPRYWTWFDLCANVVGYIPLGVLMVLALYPWLRGLAALALSIATGILIAACMEAIQTYLPSRVPSNLDLLTNSLGMALGAVLGTLLHHLFLEHSRLRSLRNRWFSDQASRGLIVVALWPLAQIYPQAYLFGHGQLLPVVSGWLSDWMTTPIDLSQLFWEETNLSVEQYLLAEAIITACSLTGAVLTLLCQMRNQAPKTGLAMLLVAAAIAVKAMASAILFTPDNAFTWLTPSAGGGLLIGTVMLAGLAMAPALAQRRAAILALSISFLVVNLAPANPYFLSTLQDWVQGKFLNFNGAAQFLSLCWPFFALWFLTHRTHNTD